MTPETTSTVSIVNSSGIKENVNVCSNKDGFQPLYNGISLDCPDGLVEFKKTSPGNMTYHCCMIPDDPVNIASNDAFTTKIKTNRDRFNELPERQKIIAAGLVSLFIAPVTGHRLRGLVFNITKYAYHHALFPMINKIAIAKDTAEKQSSIRSGFKKASKLTSGTFRVLKTLIVKMQLAILRTISARIEGDAAGEAFKLAEKEGVDHIEIEFKKFAEKLVKQKGGKRVTNKFIHMLAKDAQRKATREVERLAEKEFVEEAEKKAAKVVAERIALEAGELVASTALAAGAEAGICNTLIIASAEAGVATAETGIGFIVGMGAAATIAAVCAGIIIATVGGNVGMLFDIMYMSESQCDLGGWKQYQSNGEKIILYRDEAEGRNISQSLVYDYSPPFTFDLSNLSYLITLKIDVPGVQPGMPTSPEIKSNELKDLRNIYDIYLLAVDHYDSNLAHFKSTEPSEHNMRQINDALNDPDVPLNYNVIANMLNNKHDHPQERDLAYWTFMKEHLNPANKVGTENNLKYIRYVPTMSKGNADVNPIIGITLNDEGIRIFNLEAKALNDTFNADNIVKTIGVNASNVANYLNSSGADNITTTGDPTKLQSLIPLLINSSQYRDIKNKHQPLNPVTGKIELSQKVLYGNDGNPTKFTLESPSKYIIEKFCTVGMDKDNLPGVKYKREHPDQCNTFDQVWLHPEESGVSYDDDTGLCKYTLPWCTKTAQSSIDQNKKYDGDGNTTYNECGEDEGQQISVDIFGDYLTKRGLSYL